MLNWWRWSQEQKLNYFFNSKGGVWLLTVCNIQALHMRNKNPLGIWCIYTKESLFAVVMYFLLFPNVLASCVVWSFLTIEMCECGDAQEKPFIIRCAVLDWRCILQSFIATSHWSTFKGLIYSIEHKYSHERQEKQIYSDLFYCT